MDERRYSRRQSCPLLAVTRIRQYSWKATVGRKLQMLTVNQKLRKSERLQKPERPTRVVVVTTMENPIGEK